MLKHEFKPGSRADRAIRAAMVVALLAPGNAAHAQEQAPQEVPALQEGGVPNSFTELEPQDHYDESEPQDNYDTDLKNTNDFEEPTSPDPEDFMAGDSDQYIDQYMEEQDHHEQEVITAWDRYDQEVEAHRIKFNVRDVIADLFIQNFNNPDSPYVQTTKTEDEGTRHTLSMTRSGLETEVSVWFTDKAIDELEDSQTVRTYTISQYPRSLEFDSHLDWQLSAEPTVMVNVSEFRNGEIAVQSYDSSAEEVSEYRRAAEGRLGAILAPIMDGEDVARFIHAVDTRHDSEPAPVEPLGVLIAGEATGDDVLFDNRYHAETRLVHSIVRSTIDPLENPFSNLDPTHRYIVIPTHKPEAPDYPRPVKDENPAEPPLSDNVGVQTDIVTDVASDPAPVPVPVTSAN